MSALPGPGLVDAECPRRAAVLACVGHALVLGGPGSGKTTIALRKALARIRQGLRPEQSILFLSFSRAAVTRVLDAAKVEVPRAELDLLSVQTFHSFFWEQIKAHGYLLGAPRRLSILLPQDEKARSGGIKEEHDGWPDWLAERERLFREEGRVAFDLFAPSAAELFSRVGRSLDIVALKHPLVIVDEAQDTGEHAWRCVQLLASRTQVICLADLEQQIFDFLPGVGPERVAEIRAALRPLEVDLGTDNHRSPDTEILQFANDILATTPRGAPYRGVSRIAYPPENPPPNLNFLLRRALGQLHRSARAAGASARSVAVLTMTNRGALRMSNALNAIGMPGKLVRHKLHFDESEALLSARLAAFLLEPPVAANPDHDVATCLELIAAARSATGQAKAAIKKLREQAAKLREGRPVNVNVVKAFRAALAALRASGFTGNPVEDWLRVKAALRASGQEELTRAASKLDFLVAFRRRARISANLSAEWLRDGVYTNARAALESALAQEMILDGSEPPRGVQVMNVHKSKGKQFDAVVLVRELVRNGPRAESSFVWWGEAAPHAKSRRLVRVAITRARHHLLLLDPLWPACPLLRRHNL